MPDFQWKNCLFSHVDLMDFTNLAIMSTLILTSEIWLTPHLKAKA